MGSSLFVEEEEPSPSSRSAFVAAAVEFDRIDAPQFVHDIGIACS